MGGPDGGLRKNMARKRKQEEEHENMERWLVSYADFITLLFAFFVTMYAISRVDEQKLGSAVESLQRALGSLIPVTITQRDAGAFPSKISTPSVSIAKPEAEETSSTEQGEFTKLAEELKAEVEGAKGELDASRAALLSQIKFLIDKRGLVIRVPESFFFDSGLASLRPETIPIINVLGKSLAKIPNHIRIEGHTDSVPIRTPQFPSNWELSTARATTIVRYLLTHFQVKPQRLSATGYAEFHPIAPNTTAEGRLQNRRVDMVILSRGEAETEPPEKVAAAAAANRASKPPPPQEFPRPAGRGN